jgi:hypothetical protein
MAVLSFRSAIRIREGNPYIPVSAARAKAIKPDWRRPLPVLVRINGQPADAWRINMMPAGDGTFYLYLHGDVRKASNTKVGDRVLVEVAFDAKYRNGPMHPMPPWFDVALRNNPTALANWEALIPSRRKEILRHFSWLKSEAARARNVERALHVLSAGRGASWHEPGSAASRRYRRAALRHRRFTLTVRAFRFAPGFALFAVAFGFVRFAIALATVENS